MMNTQYKEQVNNYSKLAATYQSKIHQSKPGCINELFQTCLCWFSNLAVSRF